MIRKELSVSWNETTHFCTWMGISCGGHRHRDRVVGIDLYSGGLTGSVSPHLGNLSFLRYINLQNNSFYGPIPNEIGSLRRLKFVELSNNSFSCEIPRNLSQSIEYLNLIDNKLTGVVPFQLASLVKLEALGLGVNQLSGTIPPFIGNITSLVVLSIAACGMQGEIPESLVRLKSLNILNIGENNLSGIVPYGLYNMSTLSRFVVSFNRLQGTIPSHLDFSFSSMTWIDWSVNYFSGGIQISLSNFSSLQYIGLGDNSLTGRTMIDFSRLSALERVIISSNNLEGDLSFISTMLNCTRLRVLYMYSNLFSGSLPNSISNLSSLNYLSLGRNQLHGSIPSGFGNLMDLTVLYLDDNYFDGPIPSEFGRLNNLQNVDLSVNRLTNDIPFSLGNLTLLNHLYLSQNNFSGKIPHALSNCTNLLYLDISHNNLRGIIPPEIMSLSSISILFNLSHNILTRPIPSEAGALVNLKSLDLSHNRLSGSIPSSLSSCLLLEEVYLQENAFHGEIPDALRTLRGVQIFDLSQNNLSGEIPRFLARLTLVYLNLSFNNLEGEVPTLGVFSNKSAFSLQGNTEICGGITSLHLPPCSLKKSMRKHSSVKIKVLVPLISMGAICIIMVSFFYINRYKHRVLKGHQASMTLSLEPDFFRVSYADILKETRGFSELNLLGRGRFGSVYKGILNDGQIPIAVKVLDLTIKGGSRSFMSECNALRGIRHRNLAKLVSICSSTDFQGNDFKALVFEYMENGNLDGWLHLRSGGSIEDAEESMQLSMKQRISIAMDIAYALEYLHYGTDSTVIHGDLKPNNILLDATMTAHVGDFGLAKVLSDELSTDESSSMGIKGTIGYIPPEYGTSGLVSTEGDVYSYGILLLEMFTGKRPTSDEFNGTSSLRDLVRTALPNQVMDVVDLVILHERHYIDTKVELCLISVLETGLACTEEFPRDRMPMTRVVKALNKALHKAR